MERIGPFHPSLCFLQEKTMSQFLEDLKAFCLQNDYRVYSIGEIKDGGAAEQIDVVPGNACQNGYSVAKLFTVTAIGLLYDQGEISPRDRVVELLGSACPAYTDPRWERVTVHHLLKHSSGLPGGCLDIDVLNANDFGEDYLQYLFKLPLIADPGEKEAYSDGSFYLLSCLVQHLTGECLLSFLWRELFFPLGVREAAWSSCPMGRSIGATGLYMRSDDTAKFGELYRSGGVYQGKRYLSEEWVKLAKEQEYELHPTDVGRLYGKGGMCGQKLFIDPDHDRVVAYHAYVEVDAEAIERFTYYYED